MDEEHKMIRRYAAMLLALAALAERAAGNSWPIRCLVLWLLGRAEARAGAFAAELHPLSPLFLAEYPASDDRADEAVRLAAKFRALAAVFLSLAHQTLRLARRQPVWNPVYACLLDPDADRLLRPTDAMRPRYADTS